MALADPAAVIALARVVVMNTPRLPDAACKGLAPDMDNVHPGWRSSAALHVCAHCPELAACAAWSAHACVSGVVGAKTVRLQHRQRRHPLLAYRMTGPCITCAAAYRAPGRLRCPDCDQAWRGSQGIADPSPSKPGRTTSCDDQKRL